MSAFGGLILTNKGRNLQAKAQLGTALHFTRIALGDYDIGGESILDLSSLKHEVKSLPIVKLKLLSGGKAVVGAVFSNEDMRSGFYWREIGIFANDPENGEILYCYGNAGTNAEYIPAGGGADIIEKSIDVTAIVGNVANVTATIDQSLIFASQKDIENKVDKVPGKQLSTEDYTTQEKQKLASLSNYSHPSEHPASMIKMGDGSTVEGKITSHLADYTKLVPYAVATGTVNTYAVTLNPAPTAYTEGMALSVKINVVSTGVSTINVNGLGAKWIKKANGTAVTNLKANGIYTLRYDGTNFILQGEGASGNAIASDLRSGKTATTDAGEITGTAYIVEPNCVLNYFDLLLGKTDKIYNTFPFYYMRVNANVAAGSDYPNNNDTKPTATYYMDANFNLCPIMQTDGTYYPTFRSPKFVIAYQQANSNTIGNTAQVIDSDGSLFTLRQYSRTAINSYSITNLWSGTIPTTGGIVFPSEYDFSNSGFFTLVGDILCIAFKDTSNNWYLIKYKWSTKTVVSQHTFNTSKLFFITDTYVVARTEVNAQTLRYDIYNLSTMLLLKSVNFTLNSIVYDDIHHIDENLKVISNSYYINLSTIRSNVHAIVNEYGNFLVFLRNLSADGKQAYAGKGLKNINEVVQEWLNM